MSMDALNLFRGQILERQPSCIRGSGSKDFYGGPLVGQVLDTRPYSGIVHYEPTELVITARGGTPLSEVESALAGHQQHLAFEPPHFGHATLGGMVASGAQGSREGMSYTVRTGSGTLVRVISDQAGILVGDCVAVEEAGATANVRRLSAEACDKAYQPALAALEPEFRSEANECAIAKDQLVNAKNNAEADLAIRKLKILCND